MNDQRGRALDWARVDELFHAALEHSADQRASFLRAACGDDVGLHDEVASLLTAHAQSADFMYAFERHDAGLPGIPNTGAAPIQPNAVGLPGLTAMP